MLDTGVGGGTHSGTHTLPLMQQHPASPFGPLPPWRDPPPATPRPSGGLLPLPVSRTMAVDWWFPPLPLFYELGKMRKFLRYSLDDVIEDSLKLVMVYALWRLAALSAAHLRARVPGWALLLVAVLATYSYIDVVADTAGRAAEVPASAPGLL